MIHNTTDDLNNHLFEQLERLNDDSIKGEELKDEINRSKAMACIAQNIIGNASLALDAARFKDTAFDSEARVPKMLEGRD